MLRSKLVFKIMTFSISYKLNIIFTLSDWVFYFLSRKNLHVENIINNNKEFYVKSMLGRLSDTNQFLEENIIQTYIKKFTYKSIQATCEDYRAGAGIDLMHHRNDKAKINCPTLILWGKNSLVGKNFKPLEVWKKYAQNLEGFPLNGGHYLPEETPTEVAKKILNFFLK